VGAGDPSLSTDSVFEAQLASDVVCEQRMWNPVPKMDSGHLKGGMSVRCKVYGRNGGGFSTLKKHLEVRTRNSADKIYRGPVEESYKKMPSVYYDVGMTVDTTSGRVVMRQDVHIATDGVQTLVFDYYSTKMSGTGNAKYLRKGDAGFTLDRLSNEPGFYSIYLWSYFSVKKPGFAPTGYFIKEVKSAMNQEFANQSSEMLKEIVDNL